MDTKRLYNFIRVVDLGSVTKAAQTLNIAQPALSQWTARDDWSGCVVS